MIPTDRSVSNGRSRAWPIGIQIKALCLSKDLPSIHLPTNTPNTPLVFTMSSHATNLWGNTFRVPNSDQTITRLNSGPFQHSRGYPARPYHTTGHLVDGILHSRGDPDDLREFYNFDMLWGYTIRARVVDYPHMLERPGYRPMMYRLFNMGINDWGMPDRPPNSAPANINFRYTACMGNELLKYIYDLEDKVGLVLMPSWLAIKTSP
jgi:hypothetical protein